MTDNLTNLKKYKSISDTKSNNQIKTTDINILLNRVRLNKKKTLKKKIFVSLFLDCFVCSLIVYLII
jgi:hypothetical protein